MLKFLADQCIPKSVIRSIAELGYEVYLLREHLPIDSSDSSVADKARELKAILISLNGDFADIVAYPPASYCGIISLQVKGHPEVIPSITKRLKDYLAEHRDPSEYDGKLLVIEAHRIRVR